MKPIRHRRRRTRLYDLAELCHVRTEFVPLQPIEHHGEALGRIAETRRRSPRGSSARAGLIRSVRGFIEELVEAELDGALGRSHYQRRLTVEMVPHRKPA